jgi:hypothetical protein
MAYDNTNRGTLGRNKRREKDTHPEFTGKCDINGVEFWISGWVKESNGEKFFSLSFKAKDASPPVKQEPTDDPFADEPLPF